MTMMWVTATDGNGVDLHGLTDNNAEKDTDGRVPVWIYNDKTSGFGETVGQITLRPLKQLDDGKYGA
jgi:hypothetical protein